jgi:hypothetical protein
MDKEAVEQDVCGQIKTANSDAQDADQLQFGLRVNRETSFCALSETKESRRR